MSIIDIPRILFTGFEDYEKVSNLALGLAHELRKSGKAVACAVASPQERVSAVLERLTLRPVPCLFPGILSRDRIGALAAIALSGAELLFIVGSCDLGKLESNDKKVVDALGCKTIVVTSKLGRKAADPRLKIDGEILLAKSLGKPPSSAKLLGNIPTELLKSETLFEPGYVGLPPIVNRTEIIELGEIADKNLDIKGIADLAQTAEPYEVNKFTFAPQRRKTRIAVARDGCFSGGFADNLMLLRYFGADIKEFSPIADKVLPKNIGGVYFPASYLKDYARPLAENTHLKNEIVNFANSGGVIFSEGPSTAFLCQSFAVGSDGETFEGVGILPARGSIRESELLDAEILLKEDSILGYPGLVLRGLWAQNWKIHEIDPIITAFDISKNRSETFPGGYSPGAQIISTLAIPHFGTCREAAYNLVAAAEVYRSISQE